MSNATPPSDLATLAGRYLTFRLGEEQFAVPILQVRELIGLLPVTPVPGSPAHVKGAINLRGKIIPITDLRRRLGLPKAAAHDRGCIVVTEATRAGRAIEMGLLVDAVSEVAMIETDKLQPAPPLGGAWDPSFITALARSDEGDEVRILLDVGRVIDHSAGAAA